MTANDYEWRGLSTTLRDETLILEADRLLNRLAHQLEDAAQTTRAIYHLDPVGNFAFYAADADRLHQQAQRKRKVAELVIENLTLLGD